MIYFLDNSSQISTIVASGEGIWVDIYQYHSEGEVMNHLKTYFFRAILLSFFILGIANFAPMAAHAGTVGCPVGNCTTNAQCQDFCGGCFECDLGTCVPNDLLCDDGNACTNDICEFDSSVPLLGCVNEPLALDPTLPDDLPIACYVCEPTENGVDVDNGVCDRTAGEDCTDSVDCEVPGETCIFPNSPTSTICTGTSGPTGPLADCADGDVCTEDLCVDTGGLLECQNPERSCESFVFDGCCPSGCVGPTDPGQCPASTVGTNCDPDCWPPQVCGDGFVQPPETCDDAADQGDAGVSPSGGAVSNADCRDPGTTAECTYCGDNLIQTAAGEECDGTDTGICGAGNCDTANCICIVEELFVQGSGPPFGGPCSLNRHASNDPLKGILATLSLGLALGMLMVWRKRFN